MANLQQKIKNKNGKIFTARSCQQQDVEEIKKFLQQVALESTHTLVCKDRELSLEKLKERSELALKSPCEIYLGVFSETNIVGQLHFRVPSPDHPWIKHVGEFGMMIAAKHWGQGIGSELLEIMETFAKSIGISRIEAKVRMTNERGIALYKKRRYEIEGVRKKAAFINGHFEDEFFIAKLVANETN